MNLESEAEKTDTFTRGIDAPGTTPVVGIGLGTANVGSSDRVRALFAARVPLREEQERIYRSMGVNPYSRSGRP